MSSKKKESFLNNTIETLKDEMLKQTEREDGIFFRETQWILNIKRTLNHASNLPLRKKESTLVK